MYSELFTIMTVVSSLFFVFYSTYHRINFTYKPEIDAGLVESEEVPYVKGALHDARALPDNHPDKELLIAVLEEKLERLAPSKGPDPVEWPPIAEPFEGFYGDIGKAEGRREMSKEPEPHTRLNPPIHMTPPDSHMESLNPGRVSYRLRNPVYYPPDPDIRQPKMTWPVDDIRG